ncbi:MAG: metal-dependent transcriptional regulator [Mogibacterium sp.]|nr:metal-dependent transcriptional regulator [Mogibacterium sp.]
MYTKHWRNESQEDYLETILRITNQRGACRSIDLAEYLEVSKASVSVAMSKLMDKGLVEMDGNKYLILTDEGGKIAEECFEKHQLFKCFLIAAGVDEAVAEDEACAMEHVVSEDSFRKIQAYLAQLTAK